MVGPIKSYKIHSHDATFQSHSIAHSYQHMVLVIHTLGDREKASPHCNRLHIMATVPVAYPRPNREKQQAYKSAEDSVRRAVNMYRSRVVRSSDVSTKTELHRNFTEQEYHLLPFELVMVFCTHLNLPPSPLLLLVDIAISEALP